MKGGRGTAYIYLGLGMATAGSVVVASHVAAASLPVFVAAAARYAIACVILVPLALRTPWPRLCRRDLAVLAAQGAAGSLGFSVLLLLGLRHTTAADAGVVAGFLPAAVALLSWLLLGEATSRRTWLAAGLAGAGIVALHTGGEGAGAPVTGQRLLGNLLVLGAVMGEAAFVMLNKAMRVKLPPLAVAAAMSLLGLVFTAPPAAFELAATGLGATAVAGWLAVLYHAAVPTVLGFWLWYAGAARVSGGEAGPFTAVMPLSAVLLAWLVLGEPLEPRHLAGAALVLSAILLGTVRLASSRPAKPPP